MPKLFRSTKFWVVVACIVSISVVCAASMFFGSRMLKDAVGIVRSNTVNKPYPEAAAYLKSSTWPRVVVVREGSGQRLALSPDAAYLVVGTNNIVTRLVLQGIDGDTLEHGGVVKEYV